MGPWARCKPCREEQALCWSQGTWAPGLPSRARGGPGLVVKSIFVPAHCLVSLQDPDKLFFPGELRGLSKLRDEKYLAHSKCLLNAGSYLYIPCALLTPGLGKELDLCWAMDLMSGDSGWHSLCHVNGLKSPMTSGPSTAAYAEWQVTPTGWVVWLDCCLY